MNIHLIPELKKKVGCSLIGESRRVNITMHELLLALIDQHAKQHGETRSRFIAQAAMEFIASHSTTE